MEPGNRHKRATIKDVAEAAGVSSATVSYVLNDLNKVTPEVDAHVRKVAQDLGYSRNRIAAALKTGRRNVIGCIFPTLASPVFPEILQAVQRRAEEHGYATFVVDSGRGGGREEEAAQVLYRHGVDGVVAVLDARPKIVSEPLFPIVVIDRHVQGLDSIQADHKAGGRLMAEHAVSLGHRKVGLLSGKQDLSSSRQRREGFLEAALGRLEIRWDVEIPLTADLPEQALRAIAARDVTLIACVNDLVAMGALGALKNERLHVPDDVCVIGFDDMQWARWPLTDLTTVHQPLTELGARAVDLLLRRLDDPSREIESVTLPVNLVKRGSTRQIEL